MINFLDEKLKTKFLNFLGVTKNIVLKNNYIVIKVYNLKGVRNIEKFIEEKLEGHLGEVTELLIHYEILKVNNEKRVVVYILKDNGDLKKILRENLKVNFKPVQIQRADNIKKKLKLKSGITILKEKDIFYVMSFVNGVLVNYDEINFFEDTTVAYHKDSLEKILKVKINKIFVSKEILKEKEKELENLNLNALGV